MAVIDSYSPTIEEYTEMYNSISSRGRVMAGADDYRIEKDMLIECGYKPGMSVFDYGCGWGSLLTVVDDYSIYFGVDISPDMIGFAKQEFPENNFEVSSIGEVNYQKVDMIIAHSVFTHVPKNIVSQALRDVSDNLKDDGFAIIDIFYTSDGDKINVTYSDDEWQDILTDNYLHGVFMGSNIRRKPFVHQYYRVTKLENI